MTSIRRSGSCLLVRPPVFPVITISLCRDSCLAQIAGLGVIAALALGWEVGGWETQGIAAGSAVLGAVLIRSFERYWPEIQEALIGITFILAAAAFADGLMCSLWFDWPAGPTVVWMLALLGIVLGTMIGASQQGELPK